MVPLGGVLNRKSLVNEAGARFHADDEEGFLSCFDARVTIYYEPELPERPIVTSREELAAVRTQIRRKFPRLEATLAHVEEHDGGVVADAVIVIPSEKDTEEGWRVALAVAFDDGLISHVRAYWQRDAAIRALKDS